MSLHQEKPVDVLLNDLYQFTCSYSYFKSKKHEQQATFEIFFRKYPFGGQYAIFAGLEAVREFINNFQITTQHKEFLQETLPQLTEEYFQWITQDFRTKIKINAIKEGSIVFAKQPLISYTGPLGFIQLLETPFLNLIGFASLVATNASRMVKAVSPKTCVQFGLRRAQGPNGGITASAYAYLGGFVGTSNVKASKIYSIPCLGSMSHAFITSYESLQEIEGFLINSVDIKVRAQQIRAELGFKTHDGELAAFLAFAKSFPNNFKTLIDTYNTLNSGMLNTIIVGLALIEAGIYNIGIRLDSGDLCELSKKCRQIWNKYVPNHRLTILASDDLNEQKIIEMQKAHSQIDIYAIGTNIATCKKQPALGLVCKLTQLNGVSKMKFSSDIEKMTLPGKKVVHRVWTDKKQKSSFDVLALDSEQLLQGENLFIDLHNEKEQKYNVTKIQTLNNPLQITKKGETLTNLRKRVEQSIGQLPEQIFSLHNAQKYQVLITNNFLQNLRATTSKHTVHTKH